MHRCHFYLTSAARIADGHSARASRRILLDDMRRRCVRSVLTLLLLAGLAAAASAAKKSQQPHLQATTSNAARNEAIQSIPLKKVHSKYRGSVQRVLTDCSLYRRLPTQMVDCDPALFTFVVKNPEVLVEMWQKMGISRVSLERTGENTFALADGAGTTGKLVIVEQKCDPDAQNRLVMYSEGAYDGKPFKRPVRAQCVLVLRSGSLRETNNRDYVACRLDTFVRIERTSLELFAKAMHPWVGKTADANFADTISFVSNLSQAAEQRPASIERLAKSLPRVSQHRQQQLARLAYNCSTKYGDSPRVARKQR